MFKQIDNKAKNTRTKNNDNKIVKKIPNEFKI